MALDAIDQIGQSLFMLRASIQEARIGAEVERVFFQSEERVIHVGTKLSA